MAKTKGKSKKELLTEQIAAAVGAGREVAVETVDFSDPNRPKTCLEVDFPIIPINQIAAIEGNAGKANLPDVEVVGAAAFQRFSLHAACGGDESAGGREQSGQSRVGCLLRQPPEARLAPPSQSRRPVHGRRHDHRGRLALGDADVRLRPQSRRVVRREKRDGAGGHRGSEAPARRHRSRSEAADHALLRLRRPKRRKGKMVSAQRHEETQQNSSAI